METPRGTGEVQSLLRGLSLLEAFADFNGAPAGLNELALRVGLSSSTTHRLLATLQSEGYVTRDREGNRYVLGHRIGGTAATIEQRTSHLRALARPHLEAISAETGETANLVVLDERRSVYIDKVDGTHALRMAMRVGSTFPAHTSASAKAILAFQPDEAQLRAIFAEEPLRKLARNTITGLRAFRAGLKEVVRAGYAVESEELEEGVSCIAAPLIGANGIAVAAISVPGPTTRIMAPSSARIGVFISKHAAEISRLLGFRKRD
jgi:IclR family acetate operon transcriptional repressor